MFVEGGDPLDVPVESLTVIPTCDPERREGEPRGGGGARCSKRTPPAAHLHP